MNRKKLLAAALAKYLSGVLAVGLLTFLPAGTLHFENAWILMGTLFIPMLITGAVLLIKSPELLKKRLNAKESEPEQKRLIFWSVLLFVAGLALAGLSFRFGWLLLPRWTVLTASALLLFGYGLWAEVMRENAYLSRTVEIQEHQHVVDTGLYGIVRHPMYTAALLVFFSIALTLGSLLSFIVFLGFIPIFVYRIKNEESVLEEGLDGYRDYKAKVRYRLIPFVW